MYVMWLDCYMKFDGIKLLQNISTFYHAMHNSAKHGHLSICQSVCVIDGLDFFENNFTISLRGAFALCGPKHHGSTPRETPKVTHTPVDLSVGDIRSQIAAEWLQIAQWSQWRAYRKPPPLFRMVPSLTPYDLPFPQNGGSICPQDTEWPYLCNG